MPTPSVRHVPRRPYLPLLAVCVTLVLWSSAFVAIRHLGEHYSPAGLSLGRLLIGALCLTPLALRAGGARLSRPQWPAMLFVGIAWYAGYNLALNAGEQRIDAGTASLIIQLAPVIIGVLAVVFLGEAWTRWLVIGSAIAFAGVALIAVGSSGHGDGDPVGVLLCVGAAVAAALSVFLQKKRLSALNAVQVTWLGCIIGALVCLPWAGDLLESIRTAPTSATLWVVYLGVFPTAIAFTTYSYALRHMDATRLGVTTYLIPGITVLMAWAALAEVPPTSAYVGGALALAGVALTRRRDQAPIATSPASVSATPASTLTDAS